MEPELQPVSSVDEAYERVFGESSPSQYTTNDMGILHRGSPCVMEQE